MEFEKLGAFYLGKEYRLADRTLLDRLVMYDSRDLTTHAVCIGMTGSGKTGLCVGLLEEAAIDGVPAIIIDPKGDITNRLLMFPDLAPSDFLPWINPDDARRKGLTSEEFASTQAESWKSGLASWGQDGERIRMLRDAADVVVFTPGSDAGIPVSVIQSLAAPALSWETDAELLREKVSGTVTALLGLIRVSADPLTSREHILLSSIIERSWREGRNLDLVTLIRAIQDPPLTQIGAFDIETFFPAKERFSLAMRLNHIIASPSFQPWMNGQPLDVPGFLSAKNGKPRHSIFYIAHLGEEERMFFVTLLLYQILAWVRSQTGTTSLRALLYMDEVFGFFPPVADPPSKKPMLTLLKQARAFGLGVVLTTQNPVDLDYKGLSNTGTWFIGRLQTVQDRERVLDGLEGAVQGGAFSRASLSDILSSLDNRVFLLHNVHEQAPVIFQTRWAMSYLRGPLSREQVRVLMKGRSPDANAAPAIQPGRVENPLPTPRPAPEDLTPLLPAVPPDVPQRYLPPLVPREAAEAEALRAQPGRVDQVSVIYEPGLFASGRILYTSPKFEGEESQEFALLAPYSADGAISWEAAVPYPGKAEDLHSSPQPGAVYSLPPGATRALKRFGHEKQALATSLVNSKGLILLSCPAMKLVSRPGEPANEFLLRARLAARERRDAEVGELRKRLEAKVGSLEDRLRKAEMTKDRREADAEARKREAMLSAGESVIGILLGKKSLRTGSTAASKYRQSSSAGMSAREAEENARALADEIRELRDEFEREAAGITTRWEGAVKEIVEITVRPRKAGIEITSLFLAWIPRWQVIVSDPPGSSSTRRIDASLGG